jgi:hypothetical protein
VRRLKNRVAMHERQIRWIESLDDALPGVLARVRGAPGVFERWRTLERMPTATELAELTSAAYGIPGQVAPAGRGLEWRANDGLRGRKLWVTVAPDGEGGAVLRVRDERAFPPAFWLAVLGGLILISLAMAALQPLLGLTFVGVFLVIGAHTRRTALRETRERACSTIALEDAMLALAGRPALEARVEIEDVESPSAAARARAR